MQLLRLPAAGLLLLLLLLTAAEPHLTRAHLHRWRLQM
jgi:hypothetical protein